MTSSSSDYRPAFLDHFDKKSSAAAANNNSSENKSESKPQPTVVQQPPAAQPAPVEPEEQAAFKHQFDQVTGLSEYLGLCLSA